MPPALQSRVLVEPSERWLLRGAADEPHPPNRPIPKRLAALMAAAASGDSAAVRFIASWVARVRGLAAELSIFGTDRPTAHGMLAQSLHRAIEEGRTAEVALLVDCGLTEELCEQLFDYRPLIQACLADRVECVRVLRRPKPVLEVNDGSDTCPLLVFAAATDAVAAARYLLDEGADPNLGLIGGYTPLMIAAKANAARVVSLLLEAGARRDLRNCVGETAADRASVRSLRAILQ